MGYKMTDELIQLGKEMFDDGLNYHEISQYYRTAHGIDIHPESVRYYITRRDKPKLTTREKLNSEGVSKTLVLSDLHCPYHCEYVLDVVRKHADEIDTLVLGGDVIDCYSISSYPTLEPRPLVTEMASCHRLLKGIQDIIPNAKKIIIKGNHELRWEKYLGSMKSEVNKLHSANILEEIVKGFEHHDRQVGTVTAYEPLDYTVINDWFCQVNDVIVCHPLSFSRVAGKTSEMALNYFVERGVEFSAALLAHTHKISSCCKYGKFAAEIGCLCLPQEYANSGKLTYTQQCNGYYLVTFKNGKFDINESRQYVTE